MDSPLPILPRTASQDGRFLTGKTFPEVKALALALIQEEEGPNYLSTLLQPLRPDFLVDEDDIADGFAKMSEAFEAFTQELDRIRGVFENIGVRENE